MGGMIQADVHDATHVKVGEQMHRITGTWGINEDGQLAPPSQGGFGVFIEGGERIDMFTAHSYWKIPDPPVKIFTVAEMPEKLAQAWLQHLRNFDNANPGCHFQVLGDAPDTPMTEIFEMLRVDPGFDFHKVLERGKKS